MSEVKIVGLGEVGQEYTVDDFGRVVIGREYKGETVKLAFEVQE